MPTFYYILTKQRTYMILVVPALRIKDGKCVYRIKYSDGSYCSDDPIELAKIWRRENAKSLHITDVDGIETGELKNIKIVSEITKLLDIPIELGGGIRNLEQAEKAFDAGVQRILIGNLFLDKPTIAMQILEKFGSNRVAIGISFENNKILSNVTFNNTDIKKENVIQNARYLGFTRLILRDVIIEGGTTKPNFNGIKDFAQHAAMKITYTGGINCVEDLLKIQELKPLGIDSVIIGKALYENKFPCQNIWRICEYLNFPHTAKV